MPTAFRSDGAPTETLTRQEVSMMRPPPSVVIPGSSLAASGNATVEGISGHGVLNMTTTGNSTGSTALQLPPAYYGVPLTVTAYIGSEGAFGGNVQLEWQLQDSEEVANVQSLIANVNGASPPTTEIVLGTNAVVAGESLGRAVELLVRRDADDPDDTNSNNVQLYMVLISIT